MPKVDLSNETLDCACECCGRRFDYNYGRAARDKSVTCPACGFVAELGDKLDQLERQVEQMADVRIKNQG